MRHQKQPFPLSTALRAGLKHYNAKTLRDDLIAGLVVSLVALPLSMALSIAVGLPPRHGLYTAIVAGFFAALLGGSTSQVTGPTAAFVVIVAPIVKNYGLHGIIWCEIMAGLMLICLGSFRLGKLIHYVPYPVVTGFTAGIAVTIGTLALNDFFGLGIKQLSGHFVDKATTIIMHLPQMKPADFSVGLVTLLTIFLLPKVTTKIPSPPIGIAAGALLAWMLSRHGIDVDTLNTRFDYVDAAGVTHPGIQPWPPTLHLPGSGDPLFALPSYNEFQALFSSALVVAALAALESLLSATVADSIARTHHDPNAELNGIGFANIMSGLAAGIPATGAIARTSAGIHAGAKTPIASATHALLILLYVVTLAPWISYIPMAALAALLITVAWRMSHAKQFYRIVRIAPRSDTVVLLSCFLLTVFVDMVAGVSVGMVMAALLFMKRISDLSYLKISTSEKPDVTHGKVPKGTMIYRFEGPLFFGSINKTLEGADFVDEDIHKLVIDLTHVPMIDVTGMLGMKTFLMTVTHGDREVYLCGERGVTGKIRAKIAGEPFARHVHVLHTVPEALKA